MDKTTAAHKQVGEYYAPFLTIYGSDIAYSSFAHDT